MESNTGRSRRFRWAQEAIWLAAVLILSSLTGCNRLPELAAIQGEWRFDESAYLQSLRDRYSGADLRLALEIWELGKSHDRPFMSDLSIRGKRITTAGRPQQFDLSLCKTKDGRLEAKALYHEDRNDPGDAVMINVILAREGDCLRFTTIDEGKQVTYVFHRK